VQSVPEPLEVEYLRHLPVSQRSSDSHTSPICAFFAGVPLLDPLEPLEPLDPLDPLEPLDPFPHGALASGRLFLPIPLKSSSPPGPDCPSSSDGGPSGRSPEPDEPEEPAFLLSSGQPDPELDEAVPGVDSLQAVRATASAAIDETRTDNVRLITRFLLRLLSGAGIYGEDAGPGQL
jgi:hypothetical protein